MLPHLSSKLVLGQLCNAMVVGDDVPPVVPDQATAGSFLYIRIALAPGVHDGHHAGVGRLEDAVCILLIHQACPCWQAHLQEHIGAITP